MTALKLESVPVSALIPYERNSRTHSAEQIAQIAASIGEFGWTNPVLIDDANGIIAGAGRVMAAKLRGLDAVPCIRLGHLNEAQRRALVIADNKLALNAGWDDALLAVELGDLQNLGFDLSLTGFGDIELGALFAKATAGLTDPDEVPPTPAEPVTQVGDVWLLGKHRLLCGDATKADDAVRALNGVAPNLMVTDPPYGVEYDPTWRAVFNHDGPNSKRAVGKINNDDRADWREAWALFLGDVAYVWHGGLHAGVVAESLTTCGFDIRAQIIWAKQRHTFGRGHYHWQHEPCWYAVRNTGHWAGDKTQTTLWQIDNARNNETGHSAQKPVECMRRPIENNSSPGQAVYDPFVGTGTTIIAAEMTGRACHAIELNPAYCDVAMTRWENFTGLKAERDTTWTQMWTRPFDKPELIAGNGKLS